MWDDSDIQARSSSFSGFASLGAGFIHAIAAGTHAEHFATSVSMSALAAAQISMGIVTILRHSKRTRSLLVLVNAAAILGWFATRTTGIEFIPGLENSESIQAADLITALLATAAIVATIPVVRRGFLQITPALSAIMVLTFVSPAVVTTVNHQHDHGHSETSSTWPRPFFPGIGIDISGVDGVSADQENRARQLVLDTQENLVRWADYKDAEKEGWMSIGDGSTGYEHFVNGRALNDGRFLDSTVPESIVYKVYGDKKILVSAMYMAEGEPAIDAPVLKEFAGPLMEWHVHDDLCWTLRDGIRVVAGTIDAQGNCPTGSIRGGVTKPMVHVWIVPHPCGPFAAVEGLAEGRAAVPDDMRVDMCAHEH